MSDLSKVVDSLKVSVSHLDKVIAETKHEIGQVYDYIKGKEAEVARCLELKGHHIEAILHLGGSVDDQVVGAPPPSAPPPASGSDPVAVPPSSPTPETVGVTGTPVSA